MSRRTRLITYVLVAALLATGWVLLGRGTPTPAPAASDTALQRLRVRDGEQNPLVIGDAVAGNADMWRSSRERAELGRRATKGDASAAFELWQYYAFTTDDRASARRWLEQAARGGHETAQFNLAAEIGASHCAEAKRNLRKIADQTTDADTRKAALSWIGDPYLCMAKGPAG